MSTYVYVLTYNSTMYVRRNISKTEGLICKICNPLTLVTWDMHACKATITIHKTFWIGLSYQPPEPHAPGPALSSSINGYLSLWKPHIQERLIHHLWLIPNTLSLQDKTDSACICNKIYLQGESSNYVTIFFWAVYT